MKAAFGLIAMTASISAAFADDMSKRDAFESCLGAGVEKFKDLCEPADLAARAILFECKQQLIALVISLPPGSDKVALAEKHRLDKTEEVLSRLLEYRLQHPCR
ncbi:hypothetical protein [Mesorhizobium sp.]|uniref:hypothetical protein n=1 Tax=Mesorhizobium sp. TaxID=1871066 RepID=UPI000FE9B9F5|nr:hypothetical protein [Mesorhizobium sp.]RWA62143.1 MAG: hypothetical protein EOQ27_15775 [Mesorhizobium sp.]